MNSGATSERVYESIKRRIMAHEFRPGARLDPSTLADEHASSTTPVREALYELLGERLVETRLGGGFSIPLLDEPALQDLYGWSGELIAISVRNWPKSAALSGDLPQSEAVPPEQRTATLFLAVAQHSQNREHAFAVDGLNARLHAIRRLEPHLLNEIETELSAMAAAAARGDRDTFRKLSAAYHRRRQRRAAEIVRALYRSE